MVLLDWAVLLAAASITAQPNSFFPYYSALAATVPQEAAADNVILQLVT